MQMALVPNADTPYSMYPTAREDADGNPLDRAHCYQIWTPPPVKQSN